MKTLKEKFKECQKEKKELLNLLKRARADLLNYKKEERERIASFIDIEKEKFFLKLIEILDDFYFAEKKWKERIKKDRILSGIFQIKGKVEQILEKEGVKKIEISENFDPQFMKAIELVKMKGKSGKVVEVIKKGYLYKEKVLRPAFVKVGK